MCCNGFVERRFKFTTYLSRCSVNIHDFWRTASNNTKLQWLSSLSISSIALEFKIFGLMPFRSNDDTMVTKPPRTAAINADSLPMPHCWFKSIGQMYACCSDRTTFVPGKRHRSNLSINPSFPDKHAIYKGVCPKLSRKFGSNAHSYCQSSMLCRRKSKKKCYFVQNHWWDIWQVPNVTVYLDLPVFLQ